MDGTLEPLIDTGEGLPEFFGYGIHFFIKQEYSIIMPQLYFHIAFLIVLKLQICYIE